MGFTAKTRTTSKLAGVNYLIREPANATLKGELNADPVLVQANQDMVTILGAIRAKAKVSEGQNNIQSPKPFPCVTGRWMGELPFDTTTPKKVTIQNGPNKGDDEIIYPYDHASAFRLNANLFRGRTDDILKLRKMENDLTNSANNPNPGGRAGTHGKLPPSV